MARWRDADQRYGGAQSAKAMSATVAAKLITLVLFLLIWAVGVAAGCCAAYHMLRYHVAWWRSSGWLRLDLPDEARKQRRKAFIGIAVLLGCVALDFIDGAVGTWFGG